MESIDDYNIFAKPNIVVALLQRAPWYYFRNDRTRALFVCTLLIETPKMKHVRISSKSSAIPSTSEWRYETGIYASERRLQKTNLGMTISQFCFAAQRRHHKPRGFDSSCLLRIRWMEMLLRLLSQEIRLFFFRSRSWPRFCEHRG